MKRIFQNTETDVILVLDSEDIVPFFNVGGYYYEKDGEFVCLSWDEGFQYEYITYDKLYEDEEGTLAEIEPQGYAYRYFNGSNVEYLHLTDSVGISDFIEITDEMNDFEEWAEIEHIPQNHGEKRLYKAKRNGVDVTLLMTRSFYIGEYPHYYFQ